MYNFWFHEAFNGFSFIRGGPLGIHPVSGAYPEIFRGVLKFFCMDGSNLKKISQKKLF